MAAPMPKITITSNSSSSNSTTSSTTRGATKATGTGTATAVAPKSPDGLTALVAKKSLTSMSDEEIIQENLKEILDLKSREERKANGRLVAVIVCFLVIFLAIYHAWIQDALAGVLVPAGIMLSYFAWVVVLAKRDKHKRAMFEKHIEEVALKNKSELEEKHLRMKHAHAHAHGHGTPTDADQQSCSGSASSSLHYVNELLPPNGEHRKKQRRHRQRHGERPGRAQRATGADTTEAMVHRSGGPKRPSIRQKLFGQSIAHVKLVETQSDSMDSTGGAGGGGGASVPSEKRKRLQRMDTLPMPQVVRMSSAP